MRLSQRPNISLLVLLTKGEWRREGHTPIEASVTHLFRKVGELLDDANRLEIVDPLALDVLNTEDKEPILDILLDT